MIDYIDKNPFFVRRNLFKPYLNHLECPTTLDRWRRFDFRPMSNRQLKRYNRLRSYIKDFHSRHPFPCPQYVY